MNSNVELPSPELLEEQSYLVARGVRAIALVGHCPTDGDLMLRVSTRLESAGHQGAIPFVVRRDADVADFGYAAARWAVELFVWAADTPDEQRHRIIGLLLGYGADAIERFERGQSVRGF